MRPEKSEGILRQLVDGSPLVGTVGPGLKAYGILELAAAQDRQDGKEDEALRTLQLLEHPRYRGTYWAGYALFRRAIYAWNANQDADAALPLLRTMAEKYPKHPKAEDALYFYVLIAAHAGRADLASRAGAAFLKKYPNSDKKDRVAAIIRRNGRG